MPRQVQFNPDRVAYFEKAGWEAYYDRNWLRCFKLLVQLNHELFAMPWPTAIGAALDITRASLAWAPLEHDTAKVRKYLVAFYEKARRTASFKAEAERLADLEMNYWQVHRDVAIERQQHPEIDNNRPVVEAFVALHEALFVATPDQVRSSAKYRALATATVDQITGKRSKDVAADWRTTEHYLQLAYRSLQAA